MSKKRKKRNKKYRPTEASPQVHKFTAEEIEDEGKKKRRKKWLIIVAVVAIPILLVLELIF